MRTDAWLVGLLIAGLLCMTPFGVHSQSNPRPPTPPSTEHEPNGKPDKPPNAAKSRKPAKPPPKAFQPSDKIPADVPSTFPTDI